MGVEIIDETPIVYVPFIFESDDVRPEITTKSRLIKLWLFVGVILKVLSFSFVITESLYDNVFDTIFEIDTPLIDATLAIKPSPPVPELSKFSMSPTFWLVPLSIISKSFTDPDSTVCISICWVFISFASVIKSLPAVSSETLYGKVFLLNDVLEKSKDWSILKLSFSTFDLYFFPIKYGNDGINTPVDLSPVAW